MAYDDNIEQTIICDTYKDCIYELQQKYGDDFRITGKTNDFKYGPLHIRKKPCTKVTYVVIHRNAYKSAQATEEEILEQNRKQILEKNQNMILAGTINSKMDEFKAEFSKQMEKLEKIAGSADNKHETVVKIQEILEENEFSMKYIQMILERIDSTFPKSQLDDFNLVQKNVVDWIGETISIANLKHRRPPHVFVLVGPTGVGKTTTLTKLMAQSILIAKKENKERPKGCFITIDNIRAGAYDQLKKLGDAVEYPVLKAKTGDDVRAYYDEYRAHVDNIFVDTAGCSPSDSEHLGTMKKILDVDMNPDVYLTVTASTKASDLKYIFQNYEPFGFESVIITKVDESRQIGNVISVMWEKHKSISYLTDGQHPKNIKKATVVDLLMSLSGFEIDRLHIENKFGASEYV